MRLSFVERCPRETIASLEIWDASEDDIELLLSSQVTHRLQALTVILKELNGAANRRVCERLLNATSLVAQKHVIRHL